MIEPTITVTGDSAPTVEVTGDGTIVVNTTISGQVLVNVATPVSGTGSVTSSSTSLDNQIVRFDGTSGKIIQNSGITIADGANGTLSGTNTGDQNLFGTIAVAGQSNVVADSTNDTLTLVAGTNVTITTDASTDSITINSTASGTGDVVGPASATNHALVRFDGTTGKLVQNGVVTESDVGDVAAVNSLAFNINPTGALTTQGQMMWNPNEETVDIQLNGFALHTGEHVVYHVKNSTGSVIAKGTPCMYAGTNGNSGELLVQPWNGTGPSTNFMGLAAEELSNGEKGFVIAFGKILGIQTNGGNYGQSWSDGQIIYVGTTSGSLTKTQPAAPNPHIEVCAVINAHPSNGSLFVNRTLGSNIKNDEGVTITSLASGQILIANSGGTVFFNKSVSGDATLASTGALTLATVNSNVGSFGSATVAPTVTVNGKGLVTAVSTHTITPAVGSITGLGTNVATSLGNNMGASGTLAILGANTFTAAQTVNAGSTTTAGLSLNQTWNSVGTTCRAIELVVTDTNSATASTLLRMLSGSGGSTTVVSIDKNGNPTFRDTTSHSLTLQSLGSGVGWSASYNGSLRCGVGFNSGLGADILLQSVTGSSILFGSGGSFGDPSGTTPNIMGYIYSNSVGTITFGATDKDYSGAFTGAGHNCTFRAGRGSTQGTGGAGGNTTLAGADARGSGNNNGGTVSITGGAATGTGTRGAVNIASNSSDTLGFYGATAVARATTAGSAATFTANTSGIANDTATFGGYTIGQVVKALQNIGILT